MIIYKFLSKNYKVISFDIFDTLIQRKVDVPSDIFYLAGKNVLGNVDAENFRKARINAEKLARIEAKKKDVTIRDIYDYLHEYDWCKTKLMENEINEEIANCMPLDKRISFAKELKNHGKVIVLTSDMYLPEKVISKMLRKCGVDFYDALYISNEYNMCKLDGSLFNVILKEWGVSQTEIIHFGDSFRADIVGAKNAGILGVLVSRRNRIKRLLRK